jgi:hypothetical protein
MVWERRKGGREMKIERKRLEEALAYRKLINKTPFNKLDFKEYPEFKNYTQEEIKELTFTGLSNTDLIGLIGSNEHMRDLTAP